MNTTSKVLSDLFQEETNYARHAALTEILQACKARLVELFPTGIPREAIERFVEEVEQLEHSESVWNIDFIRKLSEAASSSGHIFCMNGRPNGSYIVNLLRREGVNPLKPYIYCPNCGGYEQIDPEYATYAADIGHLTCWSCDEELTADGWDVPVEAVFGEAEEDEDDELVIMVSDDFLLEARELLVSCSRAQLRIIPTDFCNMLEEAQQEGGLLAGELNCVRLGKLGMKTLCLEAPLADDLRHWIVEEGSLLYADILEHYGVRPGQITAEQVDLIEELFWYAKYAYLRTQAKPHYLQWEEVIALIKELRRENPTAAELRRDYMDHLDMIGGERRYFASPEDMKDCRCWEYVEPTPPANQAQAMYAVCDSINAMVLGLLRYKLYDDVHINEVMDFDAILDDIDRMQAGDLSGIDQESWSVEYTIRKAIYLIENGGTEDEIARVRSQLDELDAADWPAAVELKAMSFAQGNCLYARDDKTSLEYYLRFKNLIWAVSDLDDRTRVASYIGCLYYDGGKNLRPDYEEAYRYLCYALTGKFLRPRGAVAEALLSGDEEAKRRAIGVMREKV